MTEGQHHGRRDARHEHTPVTREAVTQKDGVPYAVAKTTCAACGAPLAQTRVRRAAA